MFLGGFSDSTVYTGFTVHILCPYNNSLQPVWL